MVSSAATALAFLVCWSIVDAFSSQSSEKVALIGTTGKLGRETIVQLSSAGVGVKCLLRHDVSEIVPPASLDKATNSAEVAAYLQSLPGIEMVQGDVTNQESLQELFQDTSACLAVYGPVVPKPFIKSLFPFWLKESEPTHAKQVNFEGVKNILKAMKASSTCRKLVRITGKGEDPWSVFSILINMFGTIAKGWNFEAEQLIRKSDIDYVIVRPGIMKDTVEGSPTLGVKDNGEDLPVTTVSYSQIARLVVDCMKLKAPSRMTLTAMNVGEGQDYQTLDQVQSDTRQFPESLIDEHKKAARVGGLVFMGVSLLIANVVATTIGRLVQAVVLGGR